MNIFRSRFLMVASLAGTAGLLMNVNCGGSSGGGTGGSGGTTSTGGKGGTGTGGASTGGKGGTGTGGASTGGTAGSGTGGTGTGGTAGSSAGGTGGGGGANTDGGTGTAAFAFNFDKDVEGFAINNSASSENVDDIDGGTKPTLIWDNSIGSPSSSPKGSLRLDVTFTDYSQFVLISSGTKPLINTTGKTAQVWVLLDAVDGGHEFGGGVQLEANSGASYSGSANGNYTPLTPGTWKEVTLALTASSSFDPSQVIQFQVNFTTGNRPEGGSFAGPVHATFHIDSLSDGSGLPPPVAPNATFDLNSQGFYATTAKHPDGGATPTIAFDSTTGDPNPGSIEVTLPFNGYGEGYTVQQDVAPTADLSGKTLHAKVRLDSVDGGTTSFAGGYVELFVQSSGFLYAAGNGPASSLTPGVWTDLTLNVSTPAGFVTTGYDPTKIIQVGVQFGTNGMPDGGVFGAEISPKFHIDSIVAQ